MMPTVDTPESRQKAYAQLLTEAGARNDNGASSQMMADILNAVDMARGDRTAGRWADRNSGQATASTSMLDAYAAALAAQRAKAAAGRRSGGGGGGGGLMPGYTAQTDWLQAYLDSLPSPAMPGLPGPVLPGYAASQHPVAPYSPKPAGYGASQHPVAPTYTPKKGSSTVGKVR